MNHETSVFLVLRNIRPSSKSTTRDYSENNRHTGGRSMTYEDLITEEKTYYSYHH